MHPLFGDLLNRGFDVWLFGSQVNRTNKSPLDWDFIVFGDANLLNELSGLVPVPDVDLLIVTDGDTFESPWPRASDGVIKRGSLSSWEWTQQNGQSATYRGTKWPNDWGSIKLAARVSL